ncbi:MAG: 6-carboxytetrahydropterin synthase, partial [Acidobacteriota bacterium]
VYYAARAGSRAVRCVELEAVGKSSLDEALATLEDYEGRIGFARRQRTGKTLVELLYPQIGSLAASEKTLSGVTLSEETLSEETMNEDATYTFALGKQDFKFSCAHFIVFDAERAELLHGHNYQLEVELAGRSVDEEGLLIDLEHVKSSIRDACRRLDNRTLVPTRNRHLAVEQRNGGVEIRFRDRLYRFPESDVLLLEQINTSLEVLSRMLWAELAEALAAPGLTEMTVSVSGTTGQACCYRAPLP